MNVKSKDITANKVRLPCNLLRKTILQNCDGLLKTDSRISLKPSKTFRKTIKMILNHESQSVNWNPVTKGDNSV